MQWNLLDSLQKRAVVKSQYIKQLLGNAGTEELLSKLKDSSVPPKNQPTDLHKMVDTQKAPKNKTQMLVSAKDVREIKVKPVKFKFNMTDGLNIFWTEFSCN